MPTILLALFAAMCAWGASPDYLARVPGEPEPISIQWKISAAAVMTGAALDIASSWRQPEATGIYRGGDGRFGTKGAVIKAALIGGNLALQYIVLKRTNWAPARKICIAANWIAAGTQAGVAARNWRIDNQR